MGKDTLQTLAEIKMHVRDEHLAHTEMKTRLKRHFGTADLSHSQQQGGPRPPSPSSIQPGGTAWESQIPSTSSISGGPSSPVSIPDAANQVAESNAEGTLADDQSTQLLSTIVDQFIQQGEMDSTASEDFVPITPAAITQGPITLDELFDFSRTFWVEHHQRTGRRSLDEELEVYNLLDADLPGEEGGEVAIDDTAGDILTLINA